MKLVLKTQPSEQQPKGDPTRYVRKSWSVHLGYYLLTSLASGVAITAALLLIALFEHERNEFFAGYARFLMASAGVLAVIPFFIQLVSGPFVLTRDVVCRTCRSRSQVNRIAFFKGKHVPPVRCACGGKIEPAFLWTPDSIQP
jgi:hypothetical protein